MVVSRQNLLIQQIPMKYLISCVLGLAMLPMAAFADTLSIQDHISLLQRLVAALQLQLQAQLVVPVATSTPVTATSTVATSTPDTNDYVLIHEYPVPGSSACWFEYTREITGNLIRGVACGG
jgi:hypothetical protein